MIRVWPSGCELTTSWMPMMPLAPGRLSTTTCCPRRSESLAETMRPMTSVLPPAGSPMTMRIGRIG